MNWLAGALGLVAAVSLALAWYHGSRARREGERADAAEAALGSLREVNTSLRDRLDRVIAHAAARNDREAREDARTAEGARTDARAAADLLNGLHQGGPGPGGRPGT